MKNDVILTFVPSMSMLERVLYLPICVRTQVDGRGNRDMDKCSLALTLPNHIHSSNNNKFIVVKYCYYV